MRIERVQASAHKKGRVLVFLEDGACLKITEQEALDFGLRTGDDLDGRRLEQLKKAASVSDVKATAADLIGRRAMSRRDLERKLQEKGASQAEARYAAEWLEAIGAINDADYAAILVRHCAGLGYGPARIREKLREKGVPRELWDEALDQAPDSAWQIDRFLAAKLRGRAPEEAEKRRLTSALLRRGVDWGEGRDCLLFTSPSPPDLSSSRMPSFLLIFQYPNLLNIQVHPNLFVIYLSVLSFFLLIFLKYILYLYCLVYHHLILSSC